MGPLLRRILPIALVLGAAHWLLDAYFLWQHCQAGAVSVTGCADMSFGQALWSGVPGRALVLRGIFLTAWLIGGIILAVYLSRVLRRKLAFRAHRAHLMEHLERSGDLFSRHATDGTVLYASPSFRDVLGVAPADLVGRRDVPPGLELIEPADLARQWRWVLGASGSTRLILRVRRVDGQDVWLETMARLVPAMDDREQREVICVTRDVSERRRTAVALRESESRLRLVTESMQEIIWLRSRDEILYLNPAFETVTGVPRERALGQGMTLWLDLVHEEDREALTGVLQSTIQRFGPFDHEFRIVRPDGGVRWLHARTVMLETAEDGQPLIVGTASDITSRKEAEEALRRSELTYRSLFAAAHIGIAITDRAGKLKFGNPAFAEMFGYADAVTMYREVNDAGGVASTYRDPRQREAFLGRLLAATDGWVRSTAEMRRGDGSLFTADLSSGLALNPVTGEEEITTFLQDVTRQKVLEAQLRQAQKMEALGCLAGAIAHDFNNLVQVIAGNGDMLRRKLAAEGETSEEIEHIVAAGDRAMQVVQQLLTYSRYEAIQPEVIDLNALVQELLRMLGATFGAGVRVEQELAPDLARVYADPRQLEQVVMNLVANAADALPGEGRITLRTENVRLGANGPGDRPWAKPGHYVRLTVQDDGCGIPTDARDHVYEPFYTTKGFGQGTGLGLATAYSIVRQHQGAIDFASELDAGTTFWVDLPALDEPAPTEKPKAPPAAAAVPSGRGELVLLVEDDDLVRHLTRQTLEQAGYEVLVAADGEDALEVFMAHAAEIRLLVLDVVMPRMDGRALYDNISELRAGVPVLYISGHQPSVLASEYMLEIEGELLRKPFRPADLLVRVRHILDRQPS